MLKFIKPKITIKEKENNNSAIMEIGPLGKGYGITLGNSFRRVLLSDIPGVAVTKIKLEDSLGVVLHEFSTMQGVKEDVCEIVLNVKEIKARLDSKNPCKAVIDVVGPYVVTDKDIQAEEITIINPNHHIATVEDGHKFRMELTLEQGNGYVRSETNKEMDTDKDINTIYVDSIYSPVKHVSYRVENVRVGNDTEYEKLIMEVFTNGVTSARQAISVAASVLNYHFSLFFEVDEFGFNNVIIEDSLEVRKQKLLDTPVEHLDLSVRSYNCLKRANIHTVEDLTKKTKEDMIKVRNLGKKSLDEIEFKLESMGLKFYEERS